MRMIPCLMHQIWVGPNDPPRLWLDTWRDAHPAWIYKVWTNADLLDYPWVNRLHIRRYANSQLWPGIADLMRYEILNDFGGIVVAADSVCLHPVDSLFQDGGLLYTISTEYPGNASPRNRGATTPLYASVPRHPFTASLVRELKHEKRLTHNPVRATGNRFMQRMLRKYRPSIQVWPMHYFIPEHFNGWRYDGPDRIYAKHFWGTTRNTYNQGRRIQ